jgi:uroporphyrin-III C-methyltransferase
MRMSEAVISIPKANHAENGGKVWLVGAGPGAPDLITVKGLNCLRRAEIIIYDRLIAPELLEEASPEALRIYVGKQAKAHTLSQENINVLLIGYARKGYKVVRLKGGDPFLFGRGGEEIKALSEANIPYEVIPGVSSAFAVPAYAGIPVTHRGMSSSVTIVAAHEGSEVNWQYLAQFPGTIIILMGLATLPMITQQLIHYGLNPMTHVAVIQHGTKPTQRVVVDTIDAIAQRVQQEKISSPVTTVIGSVASLHHTLAWFNVLEESSE